MLFEVFWLSLLAWLVAHRYLHQNAIHEIVLCVVEVGLVSSARLLGQEYHRQLDYLQIHHSLFVRVFRRLGVLLFQVGERRRARIQIIVDAIVMVSHFALRGS